MKMKFFDLAKKLSRNSTHYQHKLGAVIVKGNKIVGVGFNKLKTNSKSNHLYHSHHAELDAILNANTSDLTKMSIYVYRETKDGSLGSSKPCRFCEKLIASYGIKEVFYTDKAGYTSYKVA